MYSILQQKPKTLLSKPKAKVRKDPELVDAPMDVIRQMCGHWHEQVKFTFKYNDTTFGSFTMVVSPMTTGCGLSQIQGISNLPSVTPDKMNDLKKLFTDTIIPKMKGHGAGALIATLGDTYVKSCEEKLLSLGFEKLKTYANYRHGQNGAYKQRLYILTY